MPGESGIGALHRELTRLVLERAIAELGAGEMTTAEAGRIAARLARTAAREDVLERDTLDAVALPAPATETRPTFDWRADPDPDDIEPEADDFGSATERAAFEAGEPAKQEQGRWQS